MYKLDLKQIIHIFLLYFPGGSDSKSVCLQYGRPGSIPGSGRSPGEGNGNPLQHSCLENRMDGGDNLTVCENKPMTSI